MSLGSAGGNGTNITGDVEKYLVNGYLPTIGIECHVQLATKAKLFGDVDNDARDAEPNSRISAGDYALPGMMPYLNHEAVRLAVRAAKALNSDVAKVSSFDRKHYFYPDLPRGYQLSQMFHPIILTGHVDLPDGPRVRIHHAHIEDDAGKLTHHDDYSLIDLNRAGTPLIEIVSEPDIHSAAEAKAYAEELRRLMVFAGVTFGNLYYGNMRFDVNISVAKPGEKLGVRVEIKNTNSFRSIERAAEYEIARQISAIEKGEKLVQETRGWRDDSGKTVSQRSKENAQDYHYMPDPDVPPIVLTDAEIAEMQKNMPTLPPEYRAKFTTLGVDDSVIAVLLRDQKIAALIAETLDKSDIAITKNIVNLFVSTMPADDEDADTDDDTKTLPRSENLIKLASMFMDKEISSTAEKEIFVEILKKDADPRQVAEKKNLLQVSDEGAISKIVDEVLADPSSAKAVEDFRAGEEKVIGFLVGQVMKASKGQANPALAQKLIREKLQ
ncbi:MAG: Asp-tRNA(Asn)/Glu-tRNA(Gln) amidotransferase subunit GatB [Candidatus Nomurabacteria bacterium]|jgi:aspartyl-tRNA(Asn)/glutamyl-tRNA(Gln) amidotransferase subunit B|nr:Asp-tRNA(Asn)/Glu-tRNA(Gln) amidotransferase subunit GatB [Candidatus Nomurabacteria bacterium]